MKKYAVYGKVSTWVLVELEAEDKEDAIERAYEECSGPMNFVFRVSANAAFVMERCS